MMNAGETQAAVSAVPYPARSLHRDEYLAKVKAYRAEVSEIERAFREWLESEYAPSHTSQAKEAIWERAWDGGHAYGYHEVENKYIEYAQFADKILGF